MKIKLTIVIETHEENPPSLEVERVIEDSQVSLGLEERIQTTLDAYPSIGEELAQAFKQPVDRRGVAQRGIAKPSYRNGRKVHTCVNCGAPHRRINSVTGYCKEATCETGVF